MEIVLINERRSCLSGEAARGKVSSRTPRIRKGGREEEILLKSDCFQGDGLVVIVNESGNKKLIPSLLQPMSDPQDPVSDNYKNMLLLDNCIKLSLLG